MSLALFFISLIICVIGFGFSTPLSLIFWISYSTIHLVFLSSIFVGVDIDPLLGLCFFAFSLFSLVAQIIERTLFIKADIRLITDSSSANQFKGNLSAAYLYFALAVLTFVYSAGGLTGVAQNWVAIASSRNTLELIAVNISAILYLISLSHCFIAIISSSVLKNRLVSVLTIFLFMIVYGIAFRAKSMLLPALLPLIIIWYFSSDKFILKKAVQLSAAAGLGLIFYFLFTTFRWMGSFDSYSLERFWTVFLTAVSSGFERNLVEQSALVFAAYSDNGLFLYGGGYLKLVLLPLSMFSSFDITNPMYEYFSLLGGFDGQMKGSAHPTVVVDALVSFGYLGLLFGGLWIFFPRILALLRPYRSPTGFIFFLVVTSYALPLVVRGSVYLGLLYLVLYTFFIYLYLRLVKAFSLSVRLRR